MTERKRYQGVQLRFPSAFAATLILLLSSTVPAWADSLIVLTDDEMASVNAKGFYFRMDLSLEVLTDSTTAPQVVLNAGQPMIVPTETGASLSTPSSSVSLAGSAQSNLNSLVNVIGASSVINVGVNIVNIGSSTNDTIYSTNINTGAQGANFAISLYPLLP